MRREWLSFTGSQHARGKVSVCLLVDDGWMRVAAVYVLGSFSSCGLGLTEWW